MNDPRNNSSSDKLSEVLTNIIERLVALEGGGGVSRTQSEWKKTQGSQTSITSPSNINKDRLNIEQGCPENDISEIMKAVNFPRTNSAEGKKSHVLKMALWIFIHILTLLISCICIKDAYVTWETSPIVIYQSNELKSVKDIKAPAVTICFPNGLSRKKIEQLFMSFEQCINCDSTDDEDDFLPCSFNKVCDRSILYSGFVTQVICKSNVCDNCTVFKPYSNGIKINDFINGSLASHFQQILPSCNFLPNFTIQVDSEKPVRGCDDKNIQWFVSCIDQKQLCMTYNGQYHGNIYRDSVVLPLPLSHSQPNLNTEHVVSTISWFHNLTFNFESENEDYTSGISNCISSDEMSVFVHNSNEIPLTDYGYSDFTIESESHYNAIVNPDLIEAGDIAVYSPVHRNCYFPQERELLMYKNYSKTNCEIECLVNCSIEVCGCVDFDLPRPNASVRVCLDLLCDPTCDCKCLSDCEDLTYEMDVREINSPSGYPFNNSKIVLLYKAKEIRPKFRYSLSSFSEFVAFSLGVLGTFNGLSVIAFLKLLYLLILKLWNLGHSYFCNQ